jgi:hypothetical protein
MTYLLQKCPLKAEIPIKIRNHLNLATLYPTERETFLPLSTQKTQGEVFRSALFPTKTKRELFCTIPFRQKDS